MSRLESELSFAKQDSKQAVPTLTHAKIFATSKTYGWDGIYAEVGETQGWYVEGTTLQSLATLKIFISRCVMRQGYGSR